MSAGINAKASIDGAKKFQDDLKNMTARSKALDAEMKEMTARFEKDGKAMGDDAKQRELANKQIDAQKQKIALLAGELKKLEDAGEGESTAAYKLREQLAKANTELTNMEHATDGAASKSANFTSGLGKLALGAGAAVIAVKAAVGAIKSIASAAGNAAKAVWNLGVESGQWADELITLSNQTGVDTETLQEWRYASRFVDTEVSTMTKGMTKLTSAYAKGTKSKKKSIKLTKGVTVSLRKENGEIKSQAEFYLDTIDALHNMSNTAQRNAAAQKIFGKSYTEMLPLIEAGTGAIRQYAQEARDMGVIISGENVNALGAFDDQLQKVQAQFAAIKTSIAVAFLPIMTTVAERMSGFMGTVSKAISDGLQEEDIDTIVDAFFAMFEPAMSDDGKHDMNALEFIGKLASKLIEQLGLNKQKIIDLGSEVMGYVWDGVKAGLGTVWGNLVDEFVNYKLDESPINKKVSEFLDPIWNALTTGWDDFVKYDIPTAFATLGAEISLAWESIKTTAGGWLTSAYNWGVNLFTSIGNGMIFAWETVKTTVSTLWGNLKTTVSEFPGKASAWGQTLISNVSTGISDGWEFSKTLVEAVGNYLLDTEIGGWVTSAVELGKKLISGFVDAIKSKWGEKLETLFSVGSELSATFTLWVDAAKTWGKDLIKNFVAGIKNKWTELKEGLKGVGQGIKNFLGFSEPKEGPLSDFHTYAPDMIDLFVKGLRDNAWRIDSALASTFGVLPGVSPTTGGGSTTNMGGVTIIVNGAAGQDVNALADIVMERMQSAVSRREAVFA